MHITVRGKNMEVAPALRDYVEKRLGKIEKYFDYALAPQVTLSVERERHIVEVTVPINGMLLRGEEETGDMYSAVDLVLEKIEKQIEKYRTRLTRRPRNAGKDEESGYINSSNEPRVVRVKRFAVKPMTVEEAVLQMNLLGHDFFVFRNAESEEVEVVYRRKDGNYGLIEPE
ncbi:MAG: ribosome-associated translation inhibitor RaiA [Firmicutes bacterium]|nr:ribosome-associated translation inhibitor RaiA [Bacillota bacterium]